VAAVELSLPYSEGTSMANAKTEQSRVRISVGARDFSFLSSAQPALAPTQRPAQWVPGLKLTIHICLGLIL
jgi:hypothetical protein